MMTYLIGTDHLEFAVFLVVALYSRNIFGLQFIQKKKKISAQFNTLLHYYWCLLVHGRFISCTRDVTFEHNGFKTCAKTHL